MMQRVDGKKFAKKKNRSIFLFLFFFIFLIFIWFNQNKIYQHSLGLVGSKISGFFLKARSLFSIGREADELEKLKEENKILIEENAKLKEKSADAETKIEQSLFDRFNLEEIEVIGKESFFNQPLLFALKKPDSAMKSGLAVVDKKGFLVGVTDQVNLRTLQVVLAPNHHFRIGAKIAGSDWTGVVAGSHDLRSVLEMLPLETQPEPAAQIITDNSNPDIPMGIPIGSLAQISESDDHLFKEALIDLPWKSESFLKLWVVVGRKY